MSACAQSAMQRKPTAAHKHGGSALRRSGVKAECECTECAKKKGVLQRAAVNENAPEQVPDIVYDVLRSPGQPLDRGTREFMEGRFNHDFSAVRIHTDDRAADSARAVNARAYTVGSDVVFGRGQYRPATGDGKRILAHELTHTIQQVSNSDHATVFEVAETSDQYELQAESVYNNFEVSRNYNILGGAISSRLQRSYVEETNAGCGICGDAGAVGVSVHDKVLKAFIETYPNIKNFHKERLVEVGDDIESDIEPDLYRTGVDSDGTRTIWIAELKPNRQRYLGQGRGELDWYRERAEKAINIGMQEHGAMSPDHLAKGRMHHEIEVKFMDDIAVPSVPIKFMDKNVGRCPAVEQNVFVEDRRRGLFLYNCDPRRSQLTSGNCCDEGKNQKEKFPVPIHNDLKKPKIEDREKLKIEERPVLEGKTKDKSPNPIVDFPDAARVVSEFILKNLTLQGQIDQINAVAKFFSEPRNLAIVGFGVAILSLGPEALLVALSLPVTWPALALAALIIATVAASHTGENPAAIAAPPMA